MGMLLTWQRKWRQTSGSGGAYNSSVCTQATSSGGASSGGASSKDANMERHACSAFRGCRHHQTYRVYTL